ncbi:PIG-L deacetylase family protein [Kaistia granuli]|jgi:LmbE family N-acetylglucosaminyl deacetylase|uniref:PIG-L deacetylase family protein n=1 Tax=Kaistia granuli TaxID=363259 RepID=UPI0003719525|nr:PIG-L deacetylase family protein [Kaistia granuli]
MKPLSLVRPGDGLSVLCLGAHSDDIEIGAGGTLLAWIAAGARLDVRWCVLSAPGERAREAQRSAASFLAGACKSDVVAGTFSDGLFPEQGEAIKAWMENLKSGRAPDLILTHRRDDAHQDHRAVSRLTWNTFRDHLILEYEIPKWDGDLGRPNLYVPYGEDVMERKIALLVEHFASQRSKDWFDGETFRGLARLRGAECRSSGRYAEAFILRKGAIG